MRLSTLFKVGGATRSSVDDDSLLCLVISEVGVVTCNLGVATGIDGGVPFFRYPADINNSLKLI